jgi:hypothetical protein
LNEVAAAADALRIAEQVLNDKGGYSGVRVAFRHLLMEISQAAQSMPCFSLSHRPTI